MEDFYTEDNELKEPSDNWFFTNGINAKVSAFYFKKRLKKEDRKLVDLKEKGFTNIEIAQKLKCSERTIYNRLKKLQVLALKYVE